MTKALPKRQAVPVEETWDTSLIYETLEDYKEALANFDGATLAFEETYKDQLHRLDRALDALPVYEALMRESSALSYYAFLNLDVDKLNEARAQEANLFSQIYEKAYPRLAFLETELMALEDSYLDELGQRRSVYRPFLEELKRQKKHQLSTEQEELLSQLRPVFGHPSTIYSAAKFEDMVFDDFEVDGKVYANSYVLFENDYEFSHDTGIRRAAADSFYNTLRRYKNVTAQAYLSKIKNEQIEARLRGFNSTIDYLLYQQNVSRDLMDRQIDVIMSDLAPHMRRFVKLVADQHGLDKITSADLKLGLDSTYNVRITPEESRQLLKDSLAVLGEEYGRMIDRAFDERWIDFAQNEGKSTGGYCATLYQGPSYILLSWTGLMNEVLVLAHELGHAGHFQLASKQSILNYDPSLYFIEAPSTANEVLTCNQMLKNNPDPAFQAYLISELISRTYFHNMVTHLLEAAFQREVYTRLDNNEFLNGDKLCQIKRQVIQEFWGDDFEITEDAGLIWMRQPHYYSGLYPYTYSAGLTIGTVMAQQLEKAPETTVAKWLETLELGASLSAQDLALHAGVDVTTDGPLRETIAYIGGLVDRLEELLA
ncbi:oligoendopeptidase F [Streptococcus ovuberis]|uniref:Oligoendopeptidase F n=1 Tax=Streptococcus ovuberis TaxID=1936207 RepID=A0A7X6MZZ0_9STRE|nr:oligoendopeptidase F [Streptococcus ovuberis]NKZ20804.1 oligoendopeptidase F [Streptococcus ovuberis]